MYTKTKTTLHPRDLNVRPNRNEGRRKLKKKEKKEEDSLARSASP